MLNVIEDIFMVSPIKDTTGMKSVNSDNSLKTKNPSGSETDNQAAIDTLFLDSTSPQLEALKASLKDIPDINEARILYFKAELQNGNYQINNHRIAKSMLNRAEMA